MNYFDECYELAKKVLEDAEAPSDADFHKNAEDLADELTEKVMTFLGRRGYQQPF